MDRLKSMSVFVETVERGSLSAAAEAFNISAPMVSKHIRYLEERLGARILTRTTRTQSLTEMGRIYLEQCKQILAQVNEAESNAHMLRSAAIGKLRISASVSFGATLLAPALPRFLEAEPEIQVELNLNDRIIDIVDEGYDIAFRVGELKDSELIARRLKDYGMMICAAPSYLKKHGVPQTPADLINHQCLGFTHWKRRGGWNLGRPTISDKDLPTARMQSNNNMALRMVALEGFGLTMQHASMLAADVASGCLVEVLQEYCPEPMTLHLVYPRDRMPVPKLSRFIEFALNEFGYR